MLKNSLFGFDGIWNNVCGFEASEARTSHLSLQMCLSKCFENNQCRSVNYLRSHLVCHLLTTDSEDFGYFTTDPDCTHYTAKSFSPGSKYQCSGATCDMLFTCIRLSESVNYCARTECAEPVLLHGLYDEGLNIVGEVRSATCDSGYQLASGEIVSIVCESSGNWSKSFACEKPVIFDFEDFDEFSMDNAGGNHTWQSNSGATSSSGTGPDEAYHGSNYMYHEATHGAAGGNFKMASNIYLNADAQCLDFYYNMYGGDIGTLYIKYQEYGSSTEKVLWSDSGDKGHNDWLNARVPLNITHDFKLIIEGTQSGSSYEGDMAVDYIRVFDGSCTGE